MGFFKGNRFSYIVVFTADIIGFISGTALSWSSPVIPKLKSSNGNDVPFGRSITSDEESWIASLSPLGGVFGPLIFAFLLEKIGRKFSIIAATLPFLSAYLIMAFAKQISLYYISRFLMGVGIGAVFTIVPVYIVEVAEIRNRGILASSTTSFIIGGILFSYVLGPYVSIPAFNLVLAAITVIFIPVFLYLCPETPYFLVNNNQEEKARKSLHYLRRRESGVVTKELEEMKSHMEELKQGSFVDLFKTKASRTAFFFSVGLTTLQQLSGINVILAFTQNIFAATGSEIPPEICSIIVGTVQFLTCYITPLLTDRTGRKPLLYVACTGAVISQTVLGGYFFLQQNDYNVDALFWLPVVSLVVFILSYNFGIASLPWAMMSELLPLNVISAGSSATTSIYWMSGFILTKFFGSVSDSIGMGPSFWIFAACCALLFLFNFFFLFETKGKSLKEIQAILGS